MKKYWLFPIVFLLVFLGQAQGGTVIPYDLSKIPVYFYTHTDRNPVGKTSPDKYIKGMKLSQKIETYFLERANGDSSTESFKAYISKKDNKNVPSDGKHFSRLYAMGYGKNGKLVRNVIVKFGIIRPALYWYKDYQGVRYYLIRDSKCFNWSFYCELAPVPVAKKEEKISSPTDKVTVLPKGNGASLIPNVETAKVEDENNWYDDLDPDWDSWVGTGVEFGLNNDDLGYYYTGFISFFPHIVNIGDARVYFGPSYQHTAWGGSTGDVTYDGYFDLFGADLRYKMDQDEYQLKAYYGKKHGTVDGDGIPYYASAKATIFALEGAYLWWDEKQEDEIGFRFEFDLGGSKYSTWKGNPISDDSRDDETMLYVRYKHTWIEEEEDIIPATKTAQASIAHVSADDSIRVGADLGLKLYNDDIEPSIGIRHNFKNKKWSGVGAVQVHASDIVKDLWDMITSPPVESEE